MKFQAASRGAFVCTTCRWNVSLRHGQTLCKGQGHYFGILSLIKGPVPMFILNVQAFEFSIISWPAKHLFKYLKFLPSFRDSFDSSVGRAEDCSGQNVILRSLVRIRLEGDFFFFPMIFFFFVYKIALNFSLLTYTLHFSTFYCFFLERSLSSPTLSLKL